MNYAHLSALRAHHPAWRLLASPHAPLIVGFLHRVFVVPNTRMMSEADLVEALDDELFALREPLGDAEFPKSARVYLDEWASPDKGWLRKFYKPGTDDAQFDLTPATEKAIAWLVSLSERPFVGTESRMLTLFGLLEQISAGTEADPAKRLADLRAKRDALDAEMMRVRGGDVPLLDDTAIKDRFQQFQYLARELLADFREVEQNFRRLDRSVREKIALWQGAKGALLDEIMGERDAIGDSDQGRSFRAFWDFILSNQRQEELSERLERVLALPAVIALAPDARTRRVHHDWLDAGAHTQRTIAQLSQQLRRFLDDRAFLEHRRIMDLLHCIERKALAVRMDPPTGGFTELSAMTTEIDLPLERPLYTPSVKTSLMDLIEPADAGEIDTARLFQQVVIDKARLRAAVEGALRRQPQITLHDLVTTAPLRHGLAELVAYIELAHPQPHGDSPAMLRATIDEFVVEPIRWEAIDADGEPVTREARLPRVIFLR